MSLIHTLEKFPNGERKWDVKRNSKGKIVEIILLYRPDSKVKSLITDNQLLEILKKEKKDGKKKQQTIKTIDMKKILELQEQIKNLENALLQLSKEVTANRELIQRQANLSKKTPKKGGW